MRSLFIKIFLWFWAAMALVVLAVLLISAIAHQRREENLRREFERSPVRVFALTAARTYEREGRAALNEYLALLETQGNERGWLFDTNGVEISERNAPAEIRERAAQALRGERPEPGRPEPRRLHAFQISGPGGGRYVWVSEWLAVRRPPPFWNEPGTLLLQLLAVLVTAGLVCYWLAGYLSAPVAKLRAATQRLAAGDLSARFGAEQFRRRDEVTELGRDFDQMAERIESLVNAQRRLLGDIAHELRSPLARLNVALGLARRNGGGSAHDRIERESRRLSELTDQLLMLTCLESGTDEVRPQLLPLAHLVREIAQDADFEARSRNRAVRILSEVDCEVSGREELLRSAIENVVRNAVRYTAEGTAVEISLQHSDSHPGQVTVSVRDHGQGVPPESLSELFRPFYRVGDARDRQSGGIGIGLAITERAIRLHGGTVSASNAPDKGLIVMLSLPCQHQN